MPLPPSSLPVSKDPSGLSPEISPPTQQAAYTPFTPSDSGQRSPPTYYRGCWHVVSRGFLPGYRHFFRPQGQCFTTRRPSSRTRRRSRQGFPHCEKFPTAASRRSLGRVSVPVWLIVLSDQLRIVALVSRYLTNELMGRGPVIQRIAPFIFEGCPSEIECGIS